MKINKDLYVWTENEKELLLRDTLEYIMFAWVLSKILLIIQQREIKL